VHVAGTLCHVWSPRCRYAAEIRNPFCSKRQWLGTFDHAVEAAQAYDRAARAIHGADAICNFPSDVDALAPGARSAAGLLVTDEEGAQAALNQLAHDAVDAALDEETVGQVAGMPQLPV
jgi:AP2 domain